MKDSTRKRLEAIIVMVEGPIDDPDTISMDPEQHINDLHQIRSICKNALHEDPVVTPREVIEDFLKWIKEPGRVDSWDQGFFETWMTLYLKDKEAEA